MDKIMRCFFCFRRSLFFGTRYYFNNFNKIRIVSGVDSYASLSKVLVYEYLPSPIFLKLRYIQRIRIIYCIEKIVKIYFYVRRNRVRFKKLTFFFFLYIFLTLEVIITLYILK